MRRTNKTALYLDVAIVLGFAAIGFGTAWRFDVFESFSHWAKRYENWNVDELVLAALTGSLGLLFATLRGYRNVRLESRQRLRAERALAESNRRHLQILETVRDGIFGVDGHGRISFVNPAVADLLGCEPHELLGWDSHALFCEPDGAASSHQPRSCPVVVALGTGTARAIAGESFQRRDGSLFAVEGLASPIVEDGSVTGAVVTFRDITERREVERLKDEFTSVVSHELRTPLTSIRGSLGLLASGALGPLPGKGQRMLDIAVSNTDRLVRLINDILDIERIESGTIVMDRQRTVAREVADQARDAMDAMAAEAGVTLAVSVADAPLWADPDRIMQTLTNLLSNAIKFSEPGGTVELTAELRGDEVLFSVADEGRGIPALRT